jgi:hypothetical protein
VNSHSPAADDVFWALTGLLTDYSVELTPRQIDEASRRHTPFPAGMRAHVRCRRENPRQSIKSAGKLAWQGARPIVHIEVGPGPDQHALERTLRHLEHAGVADVLFEVRSAGRRWNTASVLPELLARPELRLRRFRTIGVSHGPSRVEPDHARMERALTAMNAAVADRRARMYLVAPTTSARETVRWERHTRARGNKVPIRIGIAGSTARSPRRGEPAPEALVRFAVALADEIESLIEGVHFFRSRGNVATSWWAEALSRGRFVIEGDHELRLVQARDGLRGRGSVK